MKVHTFLSLLLLMGIVEINVRSILKDLKYVAIV